MINNEWYNKKIAILGYGVEGQSSANYFLNQGAQVDVHDHKPLSTLPSNEVSAHSNQGVNFITEQNAFQNLQSYDLIMRTPTFPPYHSALASVEPSKQSSQAQLFLKKWRNQTIGISGTKGKGTTATLIHHLIHKSGKSTLLGGNIGVPLLDIMDKMSSDCIAVVELSSFQLWDISVSPHIAVLLMVVPEHLEQHRDLEDYLRSKQNLLRFQVSQDKAIILSDYTHTSEIAQNMPAEQWYVSRHNVFHGFSIKDDAIYNNAQENAIAHLSDTVLRGSHNTENLAAALLAVSLTGIDLKHASSWLADYQPLPHRLQQVGMSNQILFYDDSIATTPEAAAAGIKSFSEPMVVILGGINKQADWQSVIDAVTEADVRGCVLVGDEAESINQALQASQIHVPILVQPESLDEAIKWAAKQLPADTTSIVLLSPGAKSFDQYQDYKDRGQKFTNSVRRFIDSST